MSTVRVGGGWGVSVCGGGGGGGGDQNKLTLTGCNRVSTLYISKGGGGVQ